MTLQTLSPLQVAVQWLLFPLLLSVSLFSYVYALNHGWDTEMVVLAITVLSLITALLLERWLPFRRDWNQSKGDIVTDASSAVMLAGLADPLLKFSAPVLVVVLYSAFPSANLYDIWVAPLPLWLQATLVLLSIEFGRYWAHRLHHQITRLWWLHALHHSSQRLYAFNNLRFHPLNYALNFAVSVLPWVLLGLPAEGLLAYLALTQPILMLQHANLNLRHGVLNYLFSTNEVHRWHHSSNVTEANCNYGNALIVWDWVFGTFKYEKNGNEPEVMGLFASSAQQYPVNGSYYQQLTAFCCRR
ncbi:sterol desaturase family protein [Salinispirillum sp. LH 10-3-1]|uniref:Sterol desaturase family protein n=1 Tax=Salinispirillum sp. LH 10-3-1 TaxID=2952525 RepID=A0AB38YF93_9GAMM